jgi:hypothetical protein
MEVIYIKKLVKDGIESYTVPAVGIKTQDGMRLIPHPFGTETAAFETLEKAVAQIHRAGFSAEFNGKPYPPTGKSAPTKPKPTQRHRPGSVMQTIADALPYLLEQLSDNVPGVVASAAFALGEIKDESALPGLIHALSNDDPTVRKNVAEALAKIGRPALGPLQMALQDNHWVVRHTALTAVQELTHFGLELIPEILPHAIPLLKDESWLVRSQAAIVVGDVSKVYQELQAKEQGSGLRDSGYSA